MVHDLCAKGTEQCFNVFLPTYGYEVEGFADSLKDPSVREACVFSRNRQGFRFYEVHRVPLGETGYRMGGSSCYFGKAPAEKISV